MSDYVKAAEAGGAECGLDVVLVGEHLKLAGGVEEVGGGEGHGYWAQALR